MTSKSIFGGARILMTLLVLFVYCNLVNAAEGAASHYLPGLAGDIAIAVSPDPGLTVADGLYFQTGDTDLAVLEGKVNLGLDLDLFLNLAGATYTFDVPSLGATYSVTAIIPFGNADLDATLTGPLGNSISISEDSFDLSDVFLIPFQMNWNVGKFHFKLAQAIVAPTGGYDLDNPINLGRNYWSFDTVAAVTWLNIESGTEISVQPGIMLNTENDKTDYKTGSEFHLDFAVNQFLSETVAVGVRGYWYKQVSSDSGSGAILGGFKSEGVALGPGFLWTPKSTGGKLSIIGKWMRDVRSENRFDSDYFTLGAAWKF